MADCSISYGNEELDFKRHKTQNKEISECLRTPIQSTVSAKCPPLAQIRSEEKTDAATPNKSGNEKYKRSI